MSNNQTSTDSSIESDADRTEIALITGANRGIGHETARQLGKRGMTVFASARNEQRGEQSAKELREDGIDARFLQLDVTDESTIEAAVQRIEDEFGRLDVLVNNAVVAVESNPTTPAQPSDVTAEMMRQAYEVNVFGVVAVTHSMLPLLRQAPTGRVVNVTSEAGSLTVLSTLENLDTDGVTLPYSSSKAAMNAMTLIYAAELHDTDIHVNAVSPGYTSTALHDFSGGKPVEEGAEIVVDAATISSEGPSGQFVGPSQIYEDGQGPQW